MSIDSTTNINSALALFQSGNYLDAEQQLNSINSGKQANGFSWFLVGVINSQQHNFRRAEIAFRKAIKLQPNYPDALNNLGVTQEKLNELEKASRSYQKAVKQRPDYASAWFNLGNVNQQQGKLDKAEFCYSKSIKYDSNGSKAFNNLGLIFQQSNRIDQAIIQFDTALNIDSNDSDILNNLGYCNGLIKNFENAFVYYYRALEISPNSVEILNNIGVTKHKSGDLTLAIKYLRQAIDIRPNHFESITNLANVYKDLNDADNAIKHYQLALEINTQYAPANTNLGLLETRLGNYELAKAYFCAAIRGDPNYQEAHYNLAGNLLSTLTFQSGWQEYRYRPSTRHHLAADIFQLSLSTLKNKTILLLPEQGIGDELFFLRFVKQLKQYVNAINMLASPQIFELVKTLPDLNNVVDNDNRLPEYNVAISIGDLPTLLIKDDRNTPESITLLASDANNKKANKENLPRIDELLPRNNKQKYIGITWRAGQQHENLLFKSLPLEKLLDCLACNNTTFVILQRNLTPEDWDILNNHPTNPKFIDLSYFNENLTSMLTLLHYIDDYIGVSNTNMHLYASIEKQAKVLIPCPAEFRWTFNEKESPWFPGFQIFRQNESGSWDKALSELRMVTYQP